MPEKPHNSKEKFFLDSGFSLVAQQGREANG